MCATIYPNDWMLNRKLLISLRFSGAADGVADGTRTHDDQNHNLGLYQLSYSHRRAVEYSVRASPWQLPAP